MTEVWQPVVGYEGFYEVSNLGGVRHVGALVPKAHGKDGNGYCKVELTVKGIRKTVHVHSLVVAAFIGPRARGYEVNHRDLNRANPTLSNLEYLTRSANRKYSHIWQGTRHFYAKLNDESVREIRWLLAELITHDEIAKRFGVTRECISRIAQGRNWRHVA